MGITTLTKMVAGAVGLTMVGVGIIASLSKEPKLGGPFKRPARIEQISDQTYPVTLTQGEEKSEGTFRYRVELDRGNATLYVRAQAPDHDKKDWTGKLEKVPDYANHTWIHPSSKTVFIHPREIEVDIPGIKRILYRVPQRDWDHGAEPYPEHKEAQRVIQGGEIIMNAITGAIPIPFFKDFFRAWGESVRGKEREKLMELARSFGQEYTATIIPSYVPQKLGGSVTTAIESRIPLIENELKEKVLVYIVEQFVFGNPSTPQSGTFPNKSGKLETIVAEFSLGQGEIKPLAWTGTDGNFVVFEVRGRDYRKVGFCDLRKKEKGILIESPNEIYTFPSLSPDGNQVALYSVEFRNKEFVNRKAQVFDINTKKLRVVLDLSGKRAETPLAWSENGNYLFFVNRVKNRGEEIRINLKNGRIKRRPITSYVTRGWGNQLTKEARAWCFGR